LVGTPSPLDKSSVEGHTLCPDCRGAIETRRSQGQQDTGGAGKSRFFSTFGPALGKTDAGQYFVSGADDEYCGLLKSGRKAVPAFIPG
jgi:hypothetical protein